MDTLTALGPTLQLVKAFPLLDLEVSDKIIKINGNDVRQSSPEEVFKILNSIIPNDYTPESESQLPSKDQLLRLTYIKGDDFQPFLRTR